MNSKANAASRYYAEVKRNLKCAHALRRKFLDTLEPELHNFALINPNASYEDYISEFGTPSYTAAQYMSELSKKQRQACYLPYICAAAAIVIGAYAFLALLFASQAEAAGGYMVESSAVTLSRYETTSEADAPAAAISALSATIASDSTNIFESLQNYSSPNK